MAGKIQFGSGWWFLDQKDGMQKQMNALSVLGRSSAALWACLLTCARSSAIPRHEYFRRTLCNLVGDDIENGEVPYTGYEEARVNKMIEDIAITTPRTISNLIPSCAPWKSNRQLTRSYNEKMSSFRWVICGLLFLATTVNYMDRQVLSLTWKQFYPRPSFTGLMPTMASSPLSSR